MRLFRPTTSFDFHDRIIRKLNEQQDQARKQATKEFTMEWKMASSLLILSTLEIFCFILLTDDDYYDYHNVNVA